MAKRRTKSPKPTVHDALHGFDIKINNMGGLDHSLDIDKINTFLNMHAPPEILKDPELLTEEE